MACLPRPSDPSQSPVWLVLFSPYLKPGTEAQRGLVTSSGHAAQTPWMYHLSFFKAFQCTFMYTYVFVYTHRQIVRNTSFCVHMLDLWVYFEFFY